MTKETEFSDPKYISKGDLIEICQQHKFNTDERERLSKFLYEMIEMIRRARNGKITPKDQIDAIKALQKQLQKTQEVILNLNETTAHTLNGYLAQHIAFIFSSKGLSQIFDDFGFIDSSERRIQRRVDRYEEPTEASWNLIRRENFLHERGVEAINAVLGKLDLSITNILDMYQLSSSYRGGRKKMKHRRLVLINLLSIYRELNRPVAKSSEGAHVAFCESIISAIGWSTKGIAADIPRAYKELQNRRK